MTCDHVQSAVSRDLDQGGSLPSEVRDHLSSCPECREFRTLSVEIARRYLIQVQAGIDHLRRGEAGPPSASPPGRKRMRGRAGRLIPWAACLLLSWAWVGRGTPEPPPTSPGPPGVETSGGGRRSAADPRLSVLRPAEFGPEKGEAGESSLVYDPDPVLPLRLDQEVIPPRAVEPDGFALPLNLRF